ncbi:uncharacterized protein [Montipora capricornis]|uniref:uncharacterized protein n=1 Tax=Montipora capricornis TaxID=246305 RepID=UPI0035F21B77
MSKENNPSAQEQIDKRGDPTVLKKLKSLRCILLDKLSELKILDSEIIDLVDETKIEEDVTNSCGFASAIQACIVDLETAIEAEENTGKGQDIQGTTLGSQNSNSSIQAGTQSNASTIPTHAKLPKLELRKFSGDPINWHPFWESFESAIHKNTTLSDVERFQYLKSLLEVSATQTISGLALTSSNYDHAVQLLDKRFGNKQVIISKHMELLMQLPKVSDGSDLKQLRQPLYRTEAAVRSLKGIGISTETYGTFLTPVIIGKIPQELRLILSRGTSEDWDLDTIIKSFTEELKIRKRCALGTVTEQTKLKEKREFGFGIRTESRKKILRQKGKCFGCLRSGHVSRDCQARCHRCSGKHHVALCSVQYYPEYPITTRRARDSNQEQTVSTNLYFTQDVNNKCILLQTARANVRSPHGGNSCNVRILFDSCSQKSYISSRLRSKLSLRPIGSDTVLIQTFGNNEPSLKQCSIVQFALECQDNLTVFINAYEVELICGPITNQTIEIAQQYYPHLQGLPLADHSRGDEDLEIDVMIGADHYWSVAQNHVLSTVNVSHVLKTECQIIEENLVSDDFLLKEELSKFWDYDTLGVKDSEGDFLEDYLIKVKFNGIRYEVSLPFKTEHPIIPDNYLLAQNRLVSSLQRLRSKPGLLQQYDSVIKEQLNAGVVELIDKCHDLDTLPGTVHYIPHKEVLKEDRITTKLRVVYDASAKCHNEPSLNDCPLPGPALTPLIFDVLLRFRLHKVVLIGDLEKAFLNIEVNPAERNLLRFLWVDDINSPNPEVITLRFTRLVFGLVCSPFILNVTLRNHLTWYENIDPEFVAAVVRALYVDDFASGENSVTKCFELYHKLKLRCR